MASTTPRPHERIAAAATLAGAATGRAVARRAQVMFAEGGPAFQRMSISNSVSTAGDTLLAVAMAGTLFFSVPTAQARGNVALYLVLTLAPFAVLAPALGVFLERFPVAYRHGLVASSGARAVVALLLAAQLESFWLYPLAFLSLLLSRIFGISRVSLLPVALQGATPLVAANARIAQAGVLAGGVALPVGILATTYVGGWLALVLAAVAYAGSAFAAWGLPAPPVPAPTPPGETPRLPLPELEAPRAVPVLRLPREARLAQLATAGVRLINGFLLLLLAFALRRRDAGTLDFSALLAAGGGGFLLAALVSPWMERRLREEPMVVAALAVEAAAAFIASQVFGVVAAAALAAAAGFAWGTAKLAFDGLLQNSVHARGRGAAFTRSETLFALAWVIGAILPVALPVPARVGLAAAGIAALAAQVVYVAGLLLPQTGEAATASAAEPPASREDLR